MMIGDFSPLNLPSLKQPRDVLRRDLGRTGLSADFWQLNKNHVFGKSLLDHLIDTQMELSGNHRPTYRHAVRDYRLTDVAGNVVKGILA